MGSHHLICSVPAPIGDMQGVNPEEINEWYSVSPTEPEEPASQDNHHRQHIEHEIRKGIAYPVVRIILEHIIMVLPEIIHSRPMHQHKTYRHPLAEPPKKLQNPSIVSVFSLHEQVHHLAHVHTLRKALELFFFFLSHSSCS